MTWLEETIIEQTMLEEINIWQKHESRTEISHDFSKKSQYFFKEEQSPKSADKVDAMQVIFQKS